MIGPHSAHPALGQDITPSYAKSHPYSTGLNNSELCYPDVQQASVIPTTTTATTWVVSRFPCCARFPCVHAVATTPAQQLQDVSSFLRSFPQPYQPSPRVRSDRPVQRPFRGLLGVHSRYGLYTRWFT